jgi:hypothetical protein
LQSISGNWPVVAAFTLSRSIPLNSASQGKSDDEEDDDPWRNTSAGDLAAAIDQALIEDREEAPPSGRVFVPIGEVSLRSALLTAAPDDEHTQAVADTLLEGMGDIEETVSRFTDTPPEWVVYCSTSSTMASGYQRSSKFDPLTVVEN